MSAERDEPTTLPRTCCARAALASWGCYVCHSCGGASCFLHAALWTDDNRRCFFCFGRTWCLREQRVPACILQQHRPNGRRLLLVIDGLYVAGAQRHCLALLDAFRRLGLAVIVLAVEGGGRWADRFLTGAAQLVIVPAGEFTWRDLQHAVGDADVELAVGHLAVSIRWLADRAPAGLPCIAHLHSEPSEHEAITRDWLLSLLHRFRRFLVPSTATRDRYLAELSPASDLGRVPDFQVLPNAFPERWLPAPSVRRRLRETDASLRIAVVSRIDHDKFSIPLLVGTLSIVIARFPGLSVRIAGDGEATPALQEAIAASSLRAHVSILGFLEDTEVEQLYAWSDVVFLPSKREGMPYVLLEALAAARPLVAPTVGIFLELHLPGRVFGFRPHEPTDAARAMSDAALHPPTRLDDVSAMASIPLIPFDRWVRLVAARYGLT